MLITSYCDIPRIYLNDDHFKVINTLINYVAHLNIYKAKKQKNSKVKQTYILGGLYVSLYPDDKIMIPINLHIRKENTQN